MAGTRTSSNHSFIAVLSTFFCIAFRQLRRRGSTLLFSAKRLERGLQTVGPAALVPERHHAVHEGAIQNHVLHGAFADTGAPEGRQTNSKVWLVYEVRDLLRIFVKKECISCNSSSLHEGNRSGLGRYGCADGLIPPGPQL